MTTWGSNLAEPGNSAFWRSIENVRPELYKRFSPWDRINNPASLIQILNEAGVPSPKVSSENRLQSINSAEEWWTIVLGSGYRGTIEQLSTLERERVKDANLAFIRDGKISAIETNVLYALATKSGATSRTANPR